MNNHKGETISPNSRKEDCKSVGEFDEKVFWPRKPVLLGAILHQSLVDGLNLRLSLSSMLLTDEGSSADSHMAVVLLLAAGFYTEIKLICNTKS